MNAAGTVSGLTSWNEGEEFASLGIGHFIWYPAGTARAVRGELSRAGRITWRTIGEAVPGVDARGLPMEFARGNSWRRNTSDRMEALRNLLAGTTPLQARFLAQRMHDALPKMLAAAAAG